MVGMASTGEAGRAVGRRPELDGVRGIAIVLVLVGHALAPHRFGTLAAAGVTLFFVLSGYLITGLLVDEHERTGTINVRRFYWRRFTRLAPPLAVMLAMTAPLLRPGPGAWLPAATWTANYAYLAGADTAPYGHTWSLGVEEQFYLVWPLALLALLAGDRRRVVSVAGWACAVLFAWRLALIAAGDLLYAYEAFEAAAQPVLLGAVVALCRWRTPAALGVIGAAGVVAPALAVSLWIGNPWWLTVPVLATPGAALLVAAAGACPWLTWRPLAAAGVASYSLYLWHEPISHLVSGELAIVGVAAGSAVGLVAYRYFEDPLMQKRARPGSVVAHATPAG